MLLVAADPRLAIAAPASEQRTDDGLRTGGMGVGTRPTGDVARPGTDMTTAASGTGEGKPDTKAGAVGSTGAEVAKSR